MGETSKRAEMQASKAAQLDAGTQFAIVQCVPNIANGAFWGFCNVDEAMKFQEGLKANKNVSVKKIKGGCLVEVSPEYLLNTMHRIDPMLTDQKGMSNIKEGIAKARVEFDKFLGRKAKDSSYTGGMLGIYCINDTPTISFNGERYPAFRVDLATTLQGLSKYGFNVVINGKKVPASKVKSIKELCQSMTVSPTNTGVFITISK